jgi:glycosyltransferase involved in cell wall biosynthesis
LVTVKPGAERLVMPSKAYSALVAGQALLAICRSDSDLAELVGRHDCGWVVEPGDAEGLRSALHAIATNPEDLQRKRENAFRAGHERYDAAVIARDWTALFARLLAERSCPPHTSPGEPA